MSIRGASLTTLLIKTKFETVEMENGDHKITFIKVKLKG